MRLGEQISLLIFMIIAPKGTAGVTRAGLTTLAAGPQSHRPELFDGMGVIVGIDKFVSEARDLTNFTGNAAATLSGKSPSDEQSLEPESNAAAVVSEDGPNEKE